jgi:hypothetical protein
MEIVTSWMEQGIRKIIKRQLRRRFNNISPILENRINSLSLEQIEKLADAIFDLKSLEDLSNWLDQQN